MEGLEPLRSGHRRAAAVGAIPGFTDTVDFDYQVDIAVDGTTMSYSGLGGTWELPIEAAPAGSCPRPPR